MAFRKRNYVSIAPQLASVTRIDSAAECAPEEVGLSRDAIRRIWSAAEGFYRTGTHPAVTINIRRRGKVVMNRAIGHARGNEPGAGDDNRAGLLAATPETPICLFSASKAITALLVHKLVEDGKLQLEDRVSQHIPEYGQRGKERTTIRQLLSHRAGIPTVPIKDLDYRVIYDWDAVIAMLCAAKPFEVTGEKQAYPVDCRTPGLQVHDLWHCAGIPRHRGAQCFHWTSSAMDAQSGCQTGAWRWFSGCGAHIQ